MDDIRSFQNLMAEEGCEYTPKQAEKLMKTCEKLRIQIRKNARKDPAHYQRLADATLQEKQKIRTSLAELGKELTLDELDQVISLMLHIYEQEKL